MKHFEKKFNFGGKSGGSGGGSTPPKPPTLKPPIIGAYKVGASFQFAETIDLICDGPIEGLCNKYGNKLGRKDLLQGVYLDDVPVQEPIKSTGQKRVVTSEKFESAAGNYFKVNMEYLMNTLKNSTPLEFQKAAKLDTIGRNEPNENCTKEGGNSWWSKDKDVYCEDFVEYKRRRTRTGYKVSTNAILNELEVYQQTLSRFPRFQEGNGLEQSNISFGKDLPLSYMSSLSTNRGLVANGYSSGSGWKPKSGYDLISKVGMRDYPGNSKYVEFYISKVSGQESVKSYVNQELDLIGSKKQQFFNKDGFNIINSLGDAESPLRLELGQCFTPIRELFQSSIKLYKNQNCSYPYPINSCATEIAGYDGSYKSNCQKGAEDIAAIVNNKEENRFEYEFLAKQIDSLGWEMPESITVEWLITKFEQEFGFTSETLRLKSSTNEAIFSQPFLSYRFESGRVMEGYTGTVDQKRIFVDQFDSVKPYEFDMLSSKKLDDVRFSINFLVPQLDPVTGDWNGKVKGFYYSPLNVTIKSVIQKKTKEELRASNGSFSITQNISVQGTAIKKEEVDYLSRVTGIAIFQNRNKIQGQEVSKYNYGNVLAEYRAGDGPTKQTPLSYFKDVFIEKSLDRKLIGPFNTNPGRRVQSLINWDVKGIDKYSGGSHKQRSMSIADREVIDYNRTTYIKFLEGLVLAGQGFTEGLTVYNVPREGDVPDMIKNWTVAVSEGSLDKRPDGKKKFDFSGWNSYKKTFDEKAQPVIYVVKNPQTESVFFTLVIESLYDTLHRDASGGSSGDDLGKKIPTLVNIRVEVGYIEPALGASEGFVTVYDRFFRIASLVEQRAPLDIGNPDNAKALLELDYVQELYADKSGQEAEFKGSLAEPFELPTALISDEVGQENVFRERYIKITKLSTETNSTLIFKSIKMNKVVEVIPSNLNYPYSTIVGTKLDSRTFEQLPKRTFEARLKKIKIPSNYRPLRENGTDRRFWDKASELEDLGKVDDVLVYDGDWDGTFKIGWTDNPAWILYDLLTSTRYGLGEFLGPEDVNVWQLYKIGRFCDGVDKDGYFVGVSTNQLQEGKPLGEIEPRYSCNLMFTSATKAYDALNIVASIFKGMVYYNNSTVSFSDDTIKEPSLVFTNNNIENGFFDYSNSTRDKQYNTIEVSYLDKNDNYRNKIEYVENQADVARRGVFKNTSDSYGTTSRSQALRHAKHLMYATTKENQAVTFVTSLEGLLCRPGDLIIIEDDLKSLTNNFGKVLSVDSTLGKVKLSESYESSSDLEDYITLYVPTGRQTKEDLNELSSLKRHRYLGFDIDSSDVTFDNYKLNGTYGFSNYTEGFDDTTENYKKNEYAFYTGIEDGIDHFLWYSTSYSGWIFSTGKAFQHNNLYDKYIQQQYYESALHSNLNYINNRDVLWYSFDSNQTDGRGGGGLSLKDSFLGLSRTDGVVDSDISVNETKQIYNFKTSSYANDDFGSTWDIDNQDSNFNLLPLVPEGTTYRIRRKNTDEQVYKIVGIKEIEINKYQIIANKYISGKYQEMEEYGYEFIENKNSPYDQSKYESEGRTFVELDKPRNLLVTKNISTETDPLGAESTTISLEVSWADVKNAVSYQIELRSSALGDPIFFERNNNRITIRDITANGGYILSVTALAPSYDSDNPNVSYLPSKEAIRFIDVNEFEDDQVNDASAISNILIS